MRAEPVLRVDGVVVGVREVVIPARAPEPYSDGSGRMTRGTAERRYFEAGVNTAAHYGGELGDIGAVLAVRLPDGVDQPAAGDRVSWYVDTDLAKRWNGSRFVEWVTHRLIGTVESARVVLGQPLAAVGS